MTNARTTGEPIPPSRRQRFVRWLLRTAVLSALGAVGWFGWGAWESHRYEARLAELREAGVIQDLEALQPPLPPDGENGYAQFHEAVEAARAMEREIETAARDEGTHDYVDWDEPVEAWSALGLALERRTLKALGPMLLRMDTAMLRGAIRGTGEPPLESGVLGDALFALQQWRRLAYLEPYGRKDQITRILRLFEVWATAPGERSPRIALLHNMAVPELTTWLTTPEAKRPDPAWSRTLAKEEAKVLAGVARDAIYTQSVAVWLVDAWRRGDDPMRETRETMEAMLGPLQAFGEVAPDDTLDQLSSLVEQVQGSVLAHPPHQTRWERPRLHALARALADGVPLELPQNPTLQSLREAATSEGGMTKLQRMDLRTIAMLRAARAALAARDAFARARLAGVAAEPARERAVAAARSATKDALSEQLFDVTLEFDTLTVKPPVSSVYAVMNEEVGLVWTVVLQE